MMMACVYIWYRTRQRGHRHYSPSTTGTPIGDRIPGNARGRHVYRHHQQPFKFVFRRCRCRYTATVPMLKYTATTLCRRHCLPHCIPCSSSRRITVCVVCMCIVNIVTRVWVCMYEACALSIDNTWSAVYEKFKAPPSTYHGPQKNHRRLVECVKKC